MHSEVWLAPSRLARSSLLRLLPAAERERHDRLLAKAGRDRFLAAWSLARLLLAERLDTAPHQVAVDRTCPRCGEPHGKPHLRLAARPPLLGALNLSIAHAGQWVAVALSSAGRVGVDIEELPVATDEKLRLVALSSTERAASPEIDTAAFVRYWVSKEAVVKATGDGWFTELNSFSVSAPLQPARLLSWPADSTLPDRLMLRDLGTASGYAASVAVIAGPHPVLEQDGAEVLVSHRPR
jgi:4'-phosphopantetheinyl transferase